MRRLAIALSITAAAVALGASSVWAATAAPKQPPIEVIQVSGLVDPIVVDFITKSIDHAETSGAQALVLQMNTTKAVVSDAEMATLASRIMNAKVPVGIWVGPSGAHAYGAPGQLLGVAAITGMAPASGIGKFGQPIQAGIEQRFGDAANRLRTHAIGAKEARKLGVLQLGPQALDAPTLGDFVVGMDGFVFKGSRLHTARVVATKNGPRQEAIAPSISSKLPLTDQLMHTVASPPVAYLLLSIGLLLLLFEFFTAGVGVAGVTGAICLILAAYGVAALPHRTWALVLIGLSSLAFSIDVQTSVPRFWTGAGLVSYVVGTTYLWDGVTMSWVAFVTGFIGTALAVLTGMPSMVRARFATPTIGRDWLVGEMGQAVTAVSPDGVVKVNDAQWRAHTNRATPISRGDVVRVVAIDGTILEVEPESGGARDYRERSKDRA